jgi:hypothetical protein
MEKNMCVMPVARRLYILTLSIEAEKGRGGETGPTWRMGMLSR